MFSIYFIQRGGKFTRPKAVYWPLPKSSLKFRAKLQIMACKHFNIFKEFTASDRLYNYISFRYVLDVEQSFKSTFFFEEKRPIFLHSSLIKHKIWLGGKSM